MCILESLWIQKLEDVLGKTLKTGKFEKLMKITLADNENGCMEAAHCSMCTEHSQHTDVTYCLLVDKLTKRINWGYYVRTDMMAADISTKSLRQEKLPKLMEFAQMQ